MSLDKLVDSAQLDTDLTAVADAIRAKGGTSEQLAFPAGFVSAVEAIETGGAWSWDDFVNGIIPAGACVLTSAVTTIPADRFKNNKVVTSVDAPGVTLVESNAFNGCKNLASVDLPSVTQIGYTTNTGSTSRAFSGVNGGSLSVLHFPACIYAGGTMNFENIGTAQNPVTVVLPAVTLVGTSAFSGAKLAAVDFGPDFPTINVTLFSSATVPIIILRRSSDLVTLAHRNAFNGSTFKSGGTGGTIYIPKALYDHLGDGTALDYKAATNWSTIDNYGTITWAKIEGSIYETQYADGTTIPTT